MAYFADRTSAGNTEPGKFIATLSRHPYLVEPEDFDTCPILLTQPAEDRWTPLAVSEPFLERVTQVPVRTVMLDGAGHYPIEEPGLTQMADAIANFCAERAS